MNWTHAKPKLRLLALAVLAVSLIVLLWGFFSDQEEVRFDVVNVTAVGGEWRDVTIRLTNDTEAELNIYGLPPDGMPLISLRSPDSASVTIPYDYVLAGGEVVDLSATRFLSKDLLAGESRDVTVRISTSDAENRDIIAYLPNHMGTPRWAKLYFRFPKGMRPKSLERKVHKRLKDYHTYEGEAFRAADWLEQP